VITPHEIIEHLKAYSPDSRVIVCDINSACNLKRSGNYLCGKPNSSCDVLDFDKIKEKYQKELKKEYSKSVDAVCATPQNTRLCFIEMKSWEMFLKWQKEVNEKAIKEKSEKYGDDLPEKLRSSISLCNQIMGSYNTLGDCEISYIFLTDISTDGIKSINENLAMLTGTSSNLKELCNKYSQSVMDGIKGVDTHYWCCKDFDHRIATL